MKTLILHIAPEERNYVSQLKSIFSGRATCYLNPSYNPTTVFEVAQHAKKHNATGVISNSLTLLKLINPDDPNPKISNYAGSYFKKYGIEFLFVDPLKNLFTVTYGKFIFERFVSKLLAPEKWLTQPEFKWELFDPKNMEELLRFYNECDIISIDIETVVGDEDRSIECISFTGAIIDECDICLRTVVVPCEDLFNILFIRKICATNAAKTLQNGKYDIAYLLRYGCPISNYAFDTLNLFHCWLCELPKDLGFITSMMVRDYYYHKEESSHGGKYARYSYNAKDTYYTLLATLSLLVELPNYAWNNYYKEFPVTFPCILSEHTALRLDNQKFIELKKEVENNLDNDLKRLRILVNWPSYNPSSWQQTVSIFHMMGCKELTSTGKIQMDKFASKHPLNALVGSRITSYRSDVKLNGSYFKEGVNWNGRCFYSLNPPGTDTGRLSSKESAFWCGLQIHSIPRDKDEGVSFKETIIADNEFYLGEADYSQAETRGTAYLSGDISLINAVEDKSKDFHSLNASAFFGVPYEQICSSIYFEETMEWIHKRIDKILIDIAKRTNHGANYNMGDGVLLDTMGIKRVLKAKKLLNLPDSWSLKQVTRFLLAAFDKKYPKIRDKENGFYAKVINDVMSTGYLVGPTGWTRRCFGNPKSNKLDLNSYVAHQPQSLNAMLLNQAFLKVFREVWLPNPKDFRLYCQIHDSILFGYRRSRKELAFKVAELMNIPTEVTDTFGIKRTMVVPTDLKGEDIRWSDLKPMRANKN